MEKPISVEEYLRRKVLTKFHANGMIQKDKIYKQRRNQNEFVTNMERYSIFSRDGQ